MHIDGAKRVAINYAKRAMRWSESKFGNGEEIRNWMLQNIAEISIHHQSNREGENMVDAPPPYDSGKYSFLF